MISKRLSQSTEYERPAKTITDLMQNKKDIEEQLKDFEEITDEDLNFIYVNTQLKYIGFDKKTKKELFRFGGLLVKVNKEFIVLAGKDGLRFSVQRYTRNEKNEIIHTTRFFKKIKKEELLKEQLSQTIIESTDIIEEQKLIIEKQKKELSDMKKKLKGAKL